MYDGSIPNLFLNFASLRTEYTIQITFALERRDGGLADSRRPGV